MDAKVKRDTALGDAFDLRWTRAGDYVILHAPDGVWGEAWRKLERRERRFGEEEPGEPWERDRQYTATPASATPLYPAEVDPFGPAAMNIASVFRVRWPPDGVFVPSGDVVEYDPFRHGAAIFADAQRVRVDDEPSVVRFLRRWGRLGVGIPGAPDFPADGVEQTSARFGDLQRGIDAYERIQKRRAQPGEVDRLAAFLRDELSGIRFSVRRGTHAASGREPLLAMFPVASLWQALCLELWDVVTGGKRLRRCPACDTRFVPGRSNKTYCERGCGNRKYQRERRRRERKQRRRARHVARQERQ
jgi:hypothetical protein